MMGQRKCFEFIVKDTVQNVGLRLAIAKQIPDELDVRTDNLPDGSVRVVVRGYKGDVIRFWEELQKHVLGKVENPAFSKAEGITTMPIQTDRFFHKLQCEQMEKFVDVGLDMKTSIDEMSSKIGGMDCKLDGVNFKLDGVNSTLSSMNSKLDTLPENIAKEIAKLKKNGLF
jgi:acylphosphatase